MTVSVVRERRDQTEAVLEVVAHCLDADPKQLSATTSLIDDLGVDSIDMLALAVALEVEFDLCISDEALGRLRTVNDAVLCVADAPALRRGCRTLTLNLPE